MKTAYLCPTKEHFIYQVKEWLKLGKIWSSGATDVREYYWDRNKEETCVSAEDWHINFFPKNEVYEGYEIRTVELPKSVQGHECKCGNVIICSENGVKVELPKEEPCDCDGEEYHSRGINCHIKIDKSLPEGVWEMYGANGTKVKSEPNKPMKKYRTTESHVFLKAGLKFNEDENTADSELGGSCPVETMFKWHPTWFEEVDSRWKPEIKDDYHFISYDGRVVDDCWENTTVDQFKLEFGNIFKTREEAEEARDKVRSLLLSLNN